MGRTCWAQCHQDIILYSSTSTICVTWTTQLVLLGQCIYVVTAQTAISPCQMVLIRHCQLQQSPNLIFTTTYTAVRQLSGKPPTVPPSLYVSYTNNLQLFISHLLTYTFSCQLLQDTTTVVHCVSRYLHSLCLFCSSLLTSFLSYFSHCYLCFRLVSCIVNSVL